MRHDKARLPVQSPGPGPSRYALWLVATTLLLLSACSSLPETVVTEKSEQDWIKRQQQLDAIDSWDIRGRAVILVDDEIHHVGIGWQREQERFAMVVEAPFGQGVISIESNQPADDGAAYKLSLPDGQVDYGQSAESLLTGLLGWSLPVDGLKSWIKGLPQPQTEYRYTLYGEGRLKTLQQDGWAINYLEFFKVADQAQGLPRIIYMKHQALAIKLVIERWNSIQAQDEPAFLFPGFD